MGKSSETELSESRKRLESLWESGDDAVEAAVEDAGEQNGADETPNEYVWLIKRAEEKLDAASAEDRDEIVDLLEDLKDALKAKDMDRAKEIGDELENILFYIG